MIQCRHLVNLQHWVTFSSQAQRSCLRLRLIESVWHHVAVRHSEKPPPSESDIGCCFIFLTVYRVAIPAFVWEVPSTRYVQGNGSDAGIFFSDVFNYHRLTRLVHLTLCLFIVACCISGRNVVIDRRLQTAVICLARWAVESAPLPPSVELRHNSYIFDDRGVYSLRFCTLTLVLSRLLLRWRF
jgi:hypothetical protein